MSDEADNLVLRHLRELRSDMKAGFGELRSELLDRLVKVEMHLADLRGLMLDTRAELGRQVEDLRAEIRGQRVGERLTDLEQRVAALEQRAGA